jgi:acetyltransferase-like isoleucine patch superfamily enzyme
MPELLKSGFTVQNEIRNMFTSTMYSIVYYHNNIDINIDFHLTKECTILISKKSEIYNRSPR